MHKHKRSAFTLIELMILLVILGILIALLLPAVSAAREAARRSQCFNNLAQLAKAVHIYQAKTGRLPSAAYAHGKEPKGAKVDATSVPGDAKAPFSWIAMMLPYLGRNDISLDYEKSPFEGKNAKIAAMSLPILHCPSMTHDGSTLGEDYKANGAGNKPALGQYAGIGATTRDKLVGAAPDGVLFGGEGVKFEDIKDGLSNTVMISETCEVSYSTWMDGTTASLFGVKTAPNGEDYTTLHDGDNPFISCYLAKADFGGSENWNLGPSSHHSGIVNHAFCDGRVLAISNDIEVETYRALITRAGKDDVGDF